MKRINLLSHIDLIRFISFHTHRRVQIAGSTRLVMRQLKRTTEAPQDSYSINRRVGPACAEADLGTRLAHAPTHRS